MRTFLAVGVALAMMVCVPASTAALPRDFFGLDYRPSEPVEEPALKALGVGLVRQVFDWAGIEVRPRTYRLAYYDEYVATMARQGIGVLPVIFDAPGFRSRRPRRGARRGFYPPRRARDMAAFATMLVRRYGPAGSFWQSRPELPPVPIRAWQVWNEPNLPVYWPTGPSPRAYVHLLEVVGRAIRRADRTAEVVTAGLPQSRLGTHLLAYVRGMYRAGARGSFDHLAVSAYGPTDGKVFSRLRRVRHVMNAHRDRRSGIWITEIGWATGGPRTPFTASPPKQAARIRDLLRGLVARRRALRVRGVVYYNWRDQRPAGRDFWGLHTGLLDALGTPKPGYWAFLDSVRRLR